MFSQILQEGDQEKTSAAHCRQRKMKETTSSKISWPNATSRSCPFEGTVFERKRERERVKEEESKERERGGREEEKSRKGKESEERVKKSDEQAKRIRKKMKESIGVGQERNGEEQKTGAKRDREN